MSASTTANAGDSNDQTASEARAAALMAEWEPKFEQRLASMPLCVKENLYEKIQLEIEEFKVESRIRQLKDEIRLICDKEAEEMAKVDKIQEDYKEVEFKAGEVSTMNEKASTIINTLVQKTEQMRAHLRSQIVSKWKNSERHMINLSKKISSIAENTAQLEKQNALEMNQKAAKIESQQLELQKIEEAITKVLEETKKIDEVLEFEASNVLSAAHQLQKAEQIAADLKAIEESNAQLVSVIETTTDALIDSEEALAQATSEVRMLSELAEKFKIASNRAKAEIKAKETLLEDYAYLLDIFRQSSDIADWEGDEMFQRLVSKTESYITLKRLLDLRIYENGVLMQDLLTTNLNVDEKASLLEQKQLSFKTAKDELQALKAVNDDLNATEEELSKKLADKESEVKKAEALDLKEIEDLKVQLEAQKESLLKIQLESEQLSQDKKKEEMKIKKAEDENARRTSLTSSLDRGATTSNGSFSQPIMKQEVKQEEKLVLNSQPLSSNVKTASPKDEKLVTLGKRGTSHNTSLSYPETKTRSSTTKENNAPISFGEYDIQKHGESPIKRLRVQQDEQEKAFDSDDSTSLNVSFNTDVYDLLQ